MKKLVLALAFIVTGSFAMAQQQVIPQEKKISTEELHKKREQKQQERIAKMQKELNLNETQVTKIKELHEKHNAEMKAEFEKNKGERQAKTEAKKAKKQEMENEMKNILSPEQYDKWQASKKAKMDAKKAKSKAKRAKIGIEKAVKESQFHESI